MAPRNSLFESSLKLYASLQTRGPGGCSSRSKDCYDQCSRSFSSHGAGAASVAELQVPTTLTLPDVANSRHAPLLHTSSTTSLSGGQEAGPLSNAVRSVNISRSRHAGVPSFPGLELDEEPCHSLVAAAGAAAGLQLSTAAIDAVVAAILAGDIAPVHSDSLRQLSALEPQFPGLSLDALLSADATVLKIPAAKLRLQMRIFQDLAPSYLPPIGVIMPQISRWVAASPNLIAAKLHTLNALCQRYLSMPFPVDQLTPSASFIDLPDQAHAEAVFALLMVLGRKHAQRALATDISLLALPAIQIEAVPSLIREHLNIPLDQLEVIQRMVAAVPALLHMKTGSVKAGLKQLEEQCTAVAGVPERLRQVRGYLAREELRQELELEVQAVMRGVLERHPKVLLALQRNPSAALKQVERVAAKLENMKMEAAARAAAREAGDGGEATEEGQAKELESDEGQAEAAGTTAAADAGAGVAGDKEAAADRKE